MFARWFPTLFFEYYLAKPFKTIWLSMGSAKNLDFGPRILTYKMSDQMNSETYKNMSPLV